MRTQRWINRAIPLAAAALVGATPAVFAQWGRTQNQGQELFEWAGRVDREVQIVMRGGQLSTRNVGNNETGRARSRVMMQMPRQDGEVVAQVLNGRGNVDVIQQPTPQNGYTTVIRIIDQAGGADNYQVAAYWQNYSNGDYIGNGNNRGRARGRDRNTDGIPDNRDRNNDGIRDNRDRNNDGIPDNRDRNNDGIRDNRERTGVYGRNSNQGVLHWSGNVDGELEIRIQNGRVSYRNLSGAQPTSVRADGGNVSTPRYDATVSVAEGSGRGSVYVVQQPSSNNGYTTVVRVRDPQGGYGYYDFDLVWR